MVQLRTKGNFPKWT